MKHVVLIVSLAILSLCIGGCRAVELPATHVCDWCGKTFCIASDSNPESILVAEKVAGYSAAHTAGGQTAGAKTKVITDAEGHEFCSLRCENAYEASKGIKEQRTRTITGE